MKVLYLPHFELSEESKFCRLLRALPGEVVVCVGKIFPTYRHRWQLYLYSWSRMLCYGLRARAVAARNVDAVVAYSHLVLIPFVFTKIFCVRPKLVLVGFIYTKRDSRALRFARWIYYYFIFSYVDLIVVHSSSECRRYPVIFKKKPNKFVYIPTATHIDKIEQIESKVGWAIVSAGRSNRDYDLLLKVASRVNVPFRLICDSFSSEIPLPRNVEILRDCHQDDYLRILAEARIVFIPLKEEGESSGQMVLLHSMALAKAVVITGTEEINEYIVNEKTALSIKRADEDDAVEKITRLLEDCRLITEMGESAKGQYEKRHTLSVSIQSVSREILLLF